MEGKPLTVATSSRSNRDADGAHYPMSAATPVPDSAAQPSGDTWESVLDEFPEITTDDPAPSTPAAATSTPAPATVTTEAPADTTDPAAASTSTTTAAAPDETPEQRAQREAVEAYWNEPDDDPDLPDALKGKSRREVYSTNKRAIQAANKAGFEKNRAVQEAEIARASLSVLREVMDGQASRATPTTPATPVAPKPTGLAAYGIADPAEAYARVPELTERLANDIQNIPQLIESKANEIAQAAVRPLLEQQQIRQRQENFALADNAYATMIAGDKSIAPDFAPTLKSKLIPLMQSANLDPRMPENWKLVLDDYRTTAARLFPSAAPTTQPAPAPAAGNRVPAPAAPPQAVKRATTGNKAQDAMARDWAADLLGKGGDVDGFTERVIARIKEDRRGGDD